MHVSSLREPWRDVSPRTPVRRENRVLRTSLPLGQRTRCHFPVGPAYIHANPELVGSHQTAELNLVKSSVFVLSEELLEIGSLHNV